MESLVIGVIASLGAGLATVIGALPVLLPINLTQRVQGIMLGFGGGVMLAATSFSLILPGTEAAIAQGYSQANAALIMVAGILLGGLFLQLAHRFMPHEHFFKGKESCHGNNLKRIWLFIAAITIHNFPEGLAVGVNFGNNNITDGIPLALGIGLQNIPEGLVVALSLVAEKYSAGYAVWISLLTGLVEPIGGLIGAGVVSIANFVLPWAMAFAAGAMLFVISDEIIPESHRKGLEKEGTIGVMIGFVVMMFLDIALG
ncbi:ZIP family metal transporter [Nostocaceae cyanobacterium CENA357]|uniref:ZIP family metal transporter n=1 Tax=Atlanticothrix silvestris CENA357 TaxID=1725252 RepID=A0A8J7L4P4_9CYAN|nr:ZIP family metal transporter [Atlanticothrix silvestris]MBH8553832.1 ZIP family metal transporter [Atlanticothrix silvestris CENA357]